MTPEQIKIVQHRRLHQFLRASCYSPTESVETLSRLGFVAKQMLNLK